jgi:S-DNA-T family DNA segregation ATPase FtsK/SpoIIIE
MASESKKRIRNTTSWAWAFGLGICAIALILALGSYQSDDPSFSSFSSAWKAPKNVLGYMGSWTSDILFQLLGLSAWFLPVLLLTALLRWMAGSQNAHSEILGTRWWLGLGLIVASSTLLIDLTKWSGPHTTYPPQGLLGIAISAAFVPFFGKIGSYLCVVSLVWAFCMTWWEELPAYFVAACAKPLRWSLPILSKIKVASFSRVTASLDNWLNGKEKAPSEVQESLAQRLKNELKIKLAAEKFLGEESAKTEDEFDDDVGDDEDGDKNLPNAQPVIRQTSQSPGDKASARDRIKKASQATKPTHWDLPPLSLLELPKKKLKGPSQEQLLETAKRISAALRSFEIDGEVVEISPGPIITMYEFQPAPGVRAQKIMAASTDLAMTLGAPSVRIVAPIPGKSVAGIEVPNPEKDEIVLRDCYELTRERAATQRLPLVLGKDGEGKAVCEDLARMPHLLVGGATSMGKSVLVNSILTGLLCRFSPDDLKLIIVDPKLVEFKVFEDIPHLLLPIVNDAADASQALKWAVGETKRRYLLMQKLAAKNLESYNTKVGELKESDHKEGETRHEKFPHIVIIIDELAELMFSAKKDVEQSIVRLTQLARAAGIHLIMATQRPSADVVTGLIKSNCPSRAALRVSSGSDSRIILDCTGAEQLLGRGDMFFTNTGPMGLRRMQSAFVSDNEIEKICDFWRGQGEPEYKEEILAPESANDSSLDSSELDNLYGEVLGFAKEKGKISTSLIQRKFQIGYSRAARIMEQLEQNGVVGDQQTAGKPRDVIF